MRSTYRHLKLSDYTKQLARILRLMIFVNMTGISSHWKVGVLIILSISFIALVPLFSPSRTILDTSEKNAVESLYDVRVYDDLKPSEDKLHKNCSYTDGVNYIVKLKRSKLELYAGDKKLFKLPSIQTLDHYANPCWLEPTKNKTMLRCLPGIVQVYSRILIQNRVPFF